MGNVPDTAYIDTPPPIFLFGFERSGTTLLSMMVGAHPRIAIPFSTTELWYRYGQLLDRYNGLDTARDVEHIVDDLLQEERICLWDVTLVRDEVLSGLAPGSYPNVIARFHTLYAQHKGKDLWGNISIATLNDMDMANMWFPNARFIHIVRDGRDVALSHETMPYGSANISECADAWIRRLRVNLKMGEILGSNRYLVVRYEDLVLESETTLRRMCEFMSVAYSSAMLEYPSMVEKKVPENRLWLWPALNKPPTKSNAYRWKKKLSTTKRVVFEGMASAMLAELGYEVYERVPKRMRAYLLELWYFLDKGGRFKRMLAKLGVRRPSRLEREWYADKQGGKGKRNYREVQQQAFGDLIKQGVYSDNFEHPPQARLFVEDCLRYVTDPVDASRGISILECGCGTGAWLGFLHRALGLRGRGVDSYYGFDLTLGMIAIAREKLERHIPSDHLHQGDILKDESYLFDGTDQTFDLIYAYDVIQQLPRRLQLTACKAMLRRLAPGGIVVIFDHDRNSLYGRKMSLKKFVTKYLKIGLVPDFYCNASYPPLAKFARLIAALGPIATEIRVEPGGNKCALIVRSLAATTKSL